MSRIASEYPAMTQTHNPNATTNQIYMRGVETILLGHTLSDYI